MIATYRCAECHGTTDVRPLDRLPLCDHCRKLDSCPECANGRAVEVAGPDPETGFRDYACSVGCGWTG